MKKFKTGFISAFINKILPLSVLLFLIVLDAQAQQGKTLVKGVVINLDQEPISFASVVHKESGTGTAADVHGKFEMAVDLKEAKGTLQISAIGYESKEIPFEVKNGEVEFKIVHLNVNNQEIKQVIVTGQVKPTPVDSSIYKVKLIAADKIQQSGSLNLNELLLTEANIRMSSDLILGSQIEMMGMGGQNVKIMVDGVPVIGRLDGNIDLSQVNLDNISQVEVIEGPMSVVYGNNALAGTINLITKQNKYHELEATARAYAESVGRYSGNLNLSKKLGKHNLSVDGAYEYFGGVDFNKSNRSMDWKPKSLYHVNLDHTWKNTNWQVNTKLGFYNDKLHYMGNIVEGYKVFDTYYYTNRYDASIGVNGKFNDRNHLDVVASYNIYNRSEQEMYKDLRTLETTWYDKIKTQDMDQKLLRAIHLHTFIPQKLSLQSGIDFNIEGMKGQRIEGGAQTIGDYAVFTNLKYAPLNAIELQPGLRWSYNTDYNSPLVYSMNFRWNLAEKLTWRVSVATGFRAPSIKELHYVFVDSNHEIYGNSDLKAESSNNYNTSFDFSTGTQKNAWKFGASLFYNDISNLITLIQEENSTAYTYSNIEDFESLGGDLNIQYAWKSLLQVRGGYGLTGRHNSYTSPDGAKYNLTNDLFAGLQFTEPFTRIRFSSDYKYNGSLPFFYTDAIDNLIKEGKQEPYQIMNVSVSRTFLKHQLQVIAGAKNLFDVTTVQRVGEGGTSHGGSGGTPVSWGRSFFVSLNYKFFK